jgi:hypothetical protein
MIVNNDSKQKDIQSLRKPTQQQQQQADRQADRSNRATGASGAKSEPTLKVTSVI